MRRLVVVLLAFLLVAGGASALVVRGHDGGSQSADRCPAGTSPLRGEGDRERPRAGVSAERDGEAGEARLPRLPRGTTLCLRDGVKLPESRADIMRAGDAALGRLALDSPHQYARAAAQKARLARTSKGVPGTAGRWSPVDRGPVVFDDPRMKAQNGLAMGLGNGAGRITDFAYDAAHDRLFAAVAQGGVWMSDDRAAHWTSVGDGLPTQLVGAVGWSSAGGGTLIALTGDNALGRYSYSGMGIFWSTDLGKTWHKAKGAPDGAQGFRIAVQPDAPATVYAATGVGLYRSTDAGRTWTDVALPTGSCAGAGTSRPALCAVANVVTDVQVRSADNYGHPGGAVVAAVGWRQGPDSFPGGAPGATGNGIYVSDTGAPGTFTRGGGGLPGADTTGRVALGAADGPNQDHNYIYAAIQDTKLFNSGRIEGLDVPSITDPVLGLDLTATPTYLNGIYVSKDFGRTWTLMEPREQFLLPTNGSTLASLALLGYGPGIQSWYDLVIQPDPYAESKGVPTNVFLGMEELWETRTAGSPQNGPTDFAAVAPYANVGANSATCILTLTGQVCDAVSKASGRTIHPDQHAIAILPPKAGETTPTIVVGNDGGAYAQRLPETGLVSKEGFGRGNTNGFNTLEAYSVGASKDGTIYSGLQDNGTVRIGPADNYKPLEVLGGDGTFTLADPDASRHALFYLPDGPLVVTHDSGVTNAEVTPTTAKALDFLTPMVFDSADKNRIAFGSRNIFISTKGIADLSADTWNEAVDLGTVNHPLQRDAESSDQDPDNKATTIALRGQNAYVGFCGPCDPIKTSKTFKRGLATNVGGQWHIAAAKGLPRRQITSVAMSPSDPKTVYVALGASSNPGYVPASALGAANVDAAGGHVYKSTDGGENFTDISGDLPDIGAMWLLVRNDQLLVATTVGVFASRDTSSGDWAPLGTGLPSAPVFSMMLDPGDPNRLLAASYGRGIYSYRFKDPANVCRDGARPTSRLAKTGARRNRAGRRLRLSGTASDRGCGRKKAGRIRRVTVSVVKVSGKRCRHLGASGRFGRPTSCGHLHFLAAKGTKRWTFTSRRALPAGRYRIRVRAVDTAGNAESRRSASTLTLTLKR